MSQKLNGSGRELAAKLARSTLDTKEGYNTKNGSSSSVSRPYLGLRGSKNHFERPYSTRNHPLLVVSTPQNCLNGRLGPLTGPISDKR